MSFCIPLKFGDFKKVLDRKFIDEDYVFPLFYFEAETKIFIYKVIKAVMFVSAVDKSSIEELESFKLQYLRQAVELPERPDLKITINVKQPPPPAPFIEAIDGVNYI